MKKRSVKEYTLFVEAWIFLAVSRSLILFRPFRTLTPLLGKPINQEQAEQAIALPVADMDLLLLIQQAILRAGRRSPWRTMCFETALAAKMMLSIRNIKSVVFFGVKKQTNKEDTMKAHAWLICSQFTITGGANNSGYIIVGRFVK